MPRVGWHRLHVGTNRETITRLVAAGTLSGFGAGQFFRCLMRLLDSIFRRSLSVVRRAGLVLGVVLLASSTGLAAEGAAPAGHRHQLQPVHSTVAVAYCLAIVLASVFGGVMPKLVTLTHGRLQLLISYVGGLMLGISVFHLLPHAMVELGGQRLDAAMIALMCGMVAMFLLLRMFHFHDHGTAEVPEPHGHDHDHDGGHCGPALVSLEVAHSQGGKSHRELSWMGVCFGLSVHSLLDGMALGASMQAGAHSPGVMWVGFGTFLAILLHKPLDSVSIAVLMREGKCPSNWRLAVNLLYSLMCPLGAIVFLLGFSGWTGQHPEVVGYTLAFAAGVFLCISLGDLLPEMEFHSHHRVQLTAALLAGIATAWFIRMAEETGAHDMLQPPSAVVERVRGSQTSVQPIATDIAQTQSRRPPLDLCQSVKICAICGPNLPSGSALHRAGFVHRLRRFSQIQSLTLHPFGVDDCVTCGNRQITNV